MDQRRVSFSSMDSDQGEFDDFATPACNETMNAAELQSEWKIDTPVWDEAPSTSSGQRGL
ncbi:Gastrula zinc finger protein XlCGF57.1, partial [Araneus ventricosus]